MNKAKRGFVAAAAAMSIWGLLPVYWKQMSGVPAYEILSHRIIWSLVAAAVFLSIRGSWGKVSLALRDRKVISLMSLSGAVIGCNWLLYIWAVNSGHVLQCSLGYYINPLINVLTGYVVFKDKLRPVQWGAIALAGAGVLYQIVLYGKVPWIALGLACSFSLYALIRKLANVDPLPGLFMETAVLAFPAVAFLTWTGIDGGGAFMTEGTRVSLFLVGTGLITSIPLLWFVQGARDISLVTVGLLQYISPTLQFMLGYWVYGESFSSAQMVTFTSIWAALTIYTVDSVNDVIRKKRGTRN
ncbi:MULTISPECIES: EamA family transporter RarD [Dethiosulfovibrio]|uniref:EamA family transporter RarD n=2 Tax=Dethiosulfovibrio TaxID=47054 RepID=A0ABS9EPB6_9BACT|nr:MULTISPECIES: EamA family transporter RarD [Dethiosulfovibrio]MCF4114758.1 EamA family transporter RarD [Dethiosulfovibrio russensis]MCF4143037.1 EamA family transporter RarD [Dethiosulfovibrio marinus]MCF4145263.1 EamA family transporter RarD [Dethiosulfovibrio acidaminovorans]